MDQELETTQRVDEEEVERRLPHPQPNPPTPGPCHPIFGCPKPTEIVCIEVRKVYDFCFQTESFDTVCTDLPEQCEWRQGQAASAECFVKDVDCREIQRTPIADGLANVTLVVRVKRIIKVFDNEGNLICRFENTLNRVKTVTLCAPEGTKIDCEATSISCGPCFISDDQVCCALSLCLLIQSTAKVKLLVPSFGFCVPSECVTAPTPPVECPPEFLFPPQCEPVDMRR